MRVSLYYRGFHKLQAVSYQLQQQANKHLEGVLDYLETAKKSIKKRQTIAKVRWKEIKKKKFNYRLEALNCWLNIQWEPKFQIMDWNENLKFEENIIGVNRPPYQIQIVPFGSDKPTFIPQNKKDWEILEEIAEMNQNINTTDGPKIISIEDDPPPPSSLRTKSNKKFDVVEFESLKNGFRVLVEPRVLPDQLTSLSYDNAPSDLKIKYFGDEYPRNLRFFDDEGNEYLLENVDDKFQWDQGKIPVSRLAARNGIEYEVIEAGKKKKIKGYEIELGEIESDISDATIDPRYYFFDQDVKNIWLKDYVHYGDKNNQIKVLKKDEDTFHIWLERLPDKEKNKFLYLPKNLTNIQNQINATRVLQKRPLEHHRNLLRLFENPEKSKSFWPKMYELENLKENEWSFLTDPRKDGTLQQRKFVEISMATPDFAFLEGPPGSGKTTALAELVFQLCKRGKKVLMVSNTHYAIDNILEKIKDNKESNKYISQVRIGSDSGKVDRYVKDFYLNRITQNIVDNSILDENEATRLALDMANLVCGTSTGLGADSRMKIKGVKRGLLAPKLYDYLIIDESSKSTFQEFLYPALFASKWILAGDIRQLSPYTEEKEIVANVESLKGMDIEHQRALLILFRLASYRTKKKDGKKVNSPLPEERWLIVEDSKVLDYISLEIESRTQLSFERNEQRDVLPEMIVYVSRNQMEVAVDNLIRIHPDKILNGDRESVLLNMANWVMVNKECFRLIQDYIPPTLMPINKIDEGSLGARNNIWLKDKGDAFRNLKEKCWYKGDKWYTYFELQENMDKYFRKHIWSKEWVWRVKRINELKLMRDSKKRKEYDDDVKFLSPFYSKNSTELADRLDDIRAIAFPSILESFQEGIPINRNNKRKSFLSEGFKASAPEIWEARHVLLEYQHRMEEPMSIIPRDCFYKGEALKDANTILRRRTNIGFTFPEDENLPILGWKQVKGRERRGRNHEEAQEIMKLLCRLEHWSSTHLPKNNDSDQWNVAVLTFYLGQESLFVQKLKEWTGQENRKSRFEKGNLRIIVGTIDRFQGREADIVLLSPRNIGKMGFLDSMNRMNVGITRARYQMLIFGNKEWFGGYRCNVEAWKKLARRAQDFS